MKTNEGIIILMCGLILYLALSLSIKNKELKDLELIHTQTVIECAEAWLRTPVKQLKRD